MMPRLAAALLLSLLAGYLSVDGAAGRERARAAKAIAAKASILIYAPRETRFLEDEKLCFLPIPREEIKRRLAAPMVDFGVFAQHDIADSPREVNSDFIVTLKLTNHRVRYQGRNQWFYPNIALWFLVWIPSWWVPDETFTADLDIELTVIDAVANEAVFRKVIRLNAEQRLCDLDRGWTPLAIFNDRFDEENYLEASRHLDERLWKKARAALADALIMEFPAELDKTGWTPRGSKWAVVVGVGEEAVRKDASRISALLAEKGILPRENIHTVTAGWEDLLWYQANFPDFTPFEVVTDILDHLKARSFPERDEVFLYFAGTGTFTEEGAPAVALDRHSGGRIRIARLLESLHRFKSSMVVVDAGFDPAGGPRSGEAASTVDGKVFAGEITRTGTSVLLAASPGAKAVLDPKTGGGVLTAVFASALGGLADKDGNGSTESGELEEYVRTQMKGYASLLGREPAPLIHIPKGARLPAKSAVTPVHIDRAIVLGLDSQGAAADAERIAEHLKANAGFRTENVFLVTRAAPAPDGKGADVRSRVWSILKEWESRPFPGRSRLFFYFAGNGSLLDGGVPAFVLGPGSDGRVTLQNLLAALGKFSTATCVIDAGFAGKDGVRTLGGGDGRPFDEEAFRALLAGRNASVVMACIPGREGLTESEGGRGAFTSLLLEGLQGDADEDRSAAVSATEIRAYLENRLASLGKERGRDASPFFHLPHDAWIPVGRGAYLAEALEREAERQGQSSEPAGSGGEAGGLDREPGAKAPSGTGEGEQGERPTEEPPEEDRGESQGSENS